MPEQVGALVEALPALPTLVGLLPSVDPLVPDQPAAVPETLPTFQALVGLLPSRRLLHQL